MTTDQINTCTEIVGTASGESFRKCMELFPDAASHPHWGAPFFAGCSIGLLVMLFIVIVATA